MNQGIFCAFWIFGFAIACGSEGGGSNPAPQPKPKNSADIVEDDASPSTPNHAAQDQGAPQ